MTTIAMPRYRSEIAAAVHETVKGMSAAGLVADETMRAFDASCLKPVKPPCQKSTQA